MRQTVSSDVSGGPGEAERLEVTRAQAPRRGGALVRAERLAILDRQVVGDAAHGPTIIRTEVFRCAHRRNPSCTAPG